MDLSILCLVFVLHFIADFLLQSREMGTKKSSEFKWLARHLQIQFLIFTIVLTFIVGFPKAYVFAISNAAIHGIIDWYIWRGYKYFVMKRIERNPSHELLSGTYGTTGQWKYYEDHWFYSTIGLDQLLHGLTMIALLWAIS